MTTLSTARLHLRPLGDPDADELHALFDEPGVGRYLLDGERVPIQWVRDEIASSRALFDEIGCGLWAVRELTDPAATAGASGVGDAAVAATVARRPPRPILGVAGFRRFFEPPDLQLLYALRPGVWGRGLATEAATAVVDHAFVALGFDEVRAATDEPNAASVAVMERLGMRRWKVEDGEPCATLFYRIDREGWEERQRRSSGER